MTATRDHGRAASARQHAQGRRAGRRGHLVGLARPLGTSRRERRGCASASSPRSPSSSTSRTSWPRACGAARRSSVGFVLSDISNPLLADIVLGAETELRRAGYSLLLMNSENDPALDVQSVRFFQTRRVDGMLLSIDRRVRPGAASTTLAQVKVPHRPGRPRGASDGMRASTVHNDHASGHGRGRAPPHRARPPQHRAHRRLARHAARSGARGGPAAGGAGADRQDRGDRPRRAVLAGARGRRRRASCSMARGRRPPSSAAATSCSWAASAVLNAGGVGRPRTSRSSPATTSQPRCSSTAHRLDLPRHGGARAGRG